MLGLLWHLTSADPDVIRLRQQCLHPSTANRRPTLMRRVTPPAAPWLLKRVSGDVNRPQTANRGPQSERAQVRAQGALHVRWTTA